MNKEKMAKYIIGIILIFLVMYTTAQENQAIANANKIATDIDVSGLNAEIMSHTAPSIVDKTKKYTIEIKVKNTGTEIWSEKDAIRLCIWQDMQDWGFRINLPENVVVNPGEEYIFILNEFGLTDADETTLEFQMVREGVTYFGEREAVNIAVASN